MQFWLSDQARLVALVGLCGIPLWIIIVYLILCSPNAQMEHANIRMHSGLDRF